MFSVLYGRCFGQSIKRRRFFNSFSAGCPSFSYIANKKNGAISAIINRSAGVLPIAPLVRKYVGIPITPPREKQISCRFVRLKATFVLTFVRSFGTGT